MRAENITIATLKDSSACMDAIDSIEMDRNNYACTDRQWVSGLHDCTLKAAAKRKLDAITRKLYSFHDGDE